MPAQRPRLPSIQQLAAVAHTIGSKNLRSYIETPSTDRDLLNFLTIRGRSFSHLGQALPMPFLPKFVFDLGGGSVNEHLFLSVVDIWTAKELLAFVSARLGYQATAENISAVFVMHRFVDPQFCSAYKALALRYDEYMVIVGHNPGSGPASVHLLGLNDLRTIAYHSVVADWAELEAGAKVDRFLPPASERVRGMGNRLIAWDGERWGYARLRHLSLVETYPLAATAVGLLPTRHQVAELQDFEPADIDQLHLLALTNGLRYGRFTSPSGVSVIGPSVAPMRWFKPPEVTDKHEGGGGGGGTYGTPGGSVTSFDCTGWESRDNCLTCCNDKQNETMARGTEVGAGVAFAGLFGGGIGSIVGAIAGVVIAGAGVAWALIEGNACRERCKNKDYGLKDYPNP